MTDPNATPPPYGEPTPPSHGQPTPPPAGGPHHPGHEPHELRPAVRPARRQRTCQPAGRSPRTSASPATSRCGAARRTGAASVAAAVLSFLGLLIVMLTKGNESPWVRRNAVNSLNFSCRSCSTRSSRACSSSR